MRGNKPEVPVTPGSEADAQLAIVPPQPEDHGLAISSKVGRRSDHGTDSALALCPPPAADTNEQLASAGCRPTRRTCRIAPLYRPGKWVIAVHHAFLTSTSSDWGCVEDHQALWSSRLQHDVVHARNWDLVYLSRWRRLAVWGICSKWCVHGSSLPLSRDLYQAPYNRPSVQARVLSACISGHHMAAQPCHYI
jgi:hypothetical protein